MEILFEKAYAYPTGAGVPQGWKISQTVEDEWVDLVPYQDFPEGPKGGGWTPGTNLVVWLSAGDKVALSWKSQGGINSGSNGRMYGLGIRRLVSTTVITIR